MASTTVRKCNCDQAYQDSKYGKGNRIMNAGDGSKATTTYKCTSCGFVYRG